MEIQPCHLHYSGNVQVTNKPTRTRSPQSSTLPHHEHDTWASTHTVSIEPADSGFCRNGKPTKMGRATKQNFNGKMGIVTNKNRNGMEEPWKSPARTMGYSSKQQNLPNSQGEKEVGRRTSTIWLFNSSPRNITMLLSSVNQVNHLFLWAIYTMANCECHNHLGGWSMLKTRCWALLLWNAEDDSMQIHTFSYCLSTICHAKKSNEWFHDGNHPS